MTQFAAYVLFRGGVTVRLPICESGLVLQANFRLSEWIHETQFDKFGCITCLIPRRDEYMYRCELGLVR